MIRSAFAMLLLPTVAFAGDISVESPMVPLAPPSAMAHAAYMTLTNSGDATKSLIGVSADGYAMAHIHKTEVVNDVVSMASVDMIELAPGKAVTLESGGLHIMLMKPAAAIAEGDAINLTLEFDDGTTQTVSAMVMNMKHSHGHGHGDHSAHGDHGS